MFENPRKGRQARNFATNVLKILDLKSSSEQIFFWKLSLGVAWISSDYFDSKQSDEFQATLGAPVNLPDKVKFIGILQDTRANFVCLSVVLKPNNFPFFIKDLNFTTP